LQVTLAGRLAEFWFLLEARLALLAGRRSRARSALKGALRRNPNSFLAHFLLGRIYWLDHAAVKSRREFDLAWQIDPERFERAYARLRTLPERVPDLFSNVNEEGVRVSARRRVRHYGDFVDEAEMRRFESLPPITRDEILHIDWDRFQDEIQD
jgi:hypothetical protein